MTTRPEFVSLSNPASLPPDYGSPDDRYPICAFRGTIGTLAQALTFQTGASASLACSAILAAVGSLLGKGLRLESTKGLTVYANPYFVIGSDSGVGKSVTAKKTIELAQIKLSAVSRSIHEDQKEQEEAGDAPYPSTTASDITDAALVRALNGNPWKCAAILSAESRGAVANILGRWSHGKLEANGLLAGSGGDFLSVHRKDGGEMTIEDPCIAVFLAVQNDAVNALYGSTEASESGLQARFLPAIVEPENEEMDHDCVDGATMAEWHRILNDAVMLYRNGGRESPLVSMSAEADDLRQAFIAETRVLIKAEPAETMRKILRRQVEMAHKVALIFHFCRHRLESADHPLCAEDWSGACRILRWHLPQAAMLLSVSSRKALEADKAKVLTVMKHLGEKVVAEDYLRKHHNIQKELLQRVAAAFPAEFKRYTDRSGKAGRPSHLFEHLAA